MGDDDIEGPIPFGKPRRHSRDHALEALAREKFLRACRDVTERFGVAAAMFGGMRGGEIAHFACDLQNPERSRNWVLLQEKRIEVPRSMPCEREDMGPCHECKHRTRSEGKKGNRRDVSYANTWMPKTEHGARTIPFDWNIEFEEIVHQFVASGAKRYPLTRQGFGKMVKRVANRAGITHLVYPHALRATAATMLADSGMVNEPQMRAYMGWSPDSDAPKVYFRKSGAALQSALREAFRDRR